MTDEREKDRGRAARKRSILRENWYRDLWLLILSLFMVGVTLGGFHILAEQQTTLTSSLCALRADLQRRVDGGKQFLAEHPDGAFGLTPSELQTSINNSQRSVIALQSIDCSAYELPVLPTQTPVVTPRSSP